MQPLTVIRVLGLAALTATATHPPAAAQDAWPTRHVTLVVPFGAGSTTDALARYLSELFKEAIGQAFIVENRGGAGGTLGAHAVVKAAPDGYTLLMGGNTTHSAAPALFKSLAYDPVKDFTPIARIGRYSSVLVTNPRQPFRTMQEFVAHVKANPGKITYGHGNSTGQIAGETLKKRLGLDMARLSYASTAPGMTDVLTNNIQMMVGDMITSPQHIETGKLIPLATIAIERSSLMPSVPTIHETVVPGFEILPWVALFGPAGLPAGIVKKLETATEQIIKRPDSPKRFAALGTELFYASGKDLGAFVTADLPKWRAGAKEAGIEPQ